MSTGKYKNAFCSNVRALRKQKDITLEELAKCSGVPLEMLEQLEQNIIPEEMMVEDTFALADVFHCKAHELFE